MNCRLNCILAICCVEYLQYRYQSFQSTPTHSTTEIMSSSRMSKRFYNVDSLLNKECFDNGEKARQENKWVFEIATEVVNKVGGIHTVIRSKAKISREELGDNYCLIGPYIEHVARTEVELKEPDDFILADVISNLRKWGIVVKYGHWLIDGYPQVLLIDYGSASWKLGEWKCDFWNICNIGIPHPDIECNDAIIFGYCVAWILEEFYKLVEEERGRPLIVAHFHEWMSGVGLILCRTRHLDVATVFTTHATLLGRYLCAANTDFYNNLSNFELDREAGQRQIYHRYCLERASVHSAHVFTTVSEITALESEHLLKRKPCIVTPNGLNMKNSVAMHEFQNLHTVAKRKIHEFVRGHFFGHYDFDLDKTLYFFISGRYEFTNKGADMFIEALARLNHYLKVANSQVTVVAFFIFPALTNSYNIEALKGQAISKQLRETIDDIKDQIGLRMFEICAAGKVPNKTELILETDINKLKRCVYSSQRSTLPSIVTHNMIDDSHDPVLSHLRRTRLFNDRSDRVKVIFHPEFLSPTSPLLPIDYEEFVRGCNLGVFPSYYEPWGYTPAECTIMGIPSVTTNLSGFGCFISEHVADPISYGIYIVDRRYKAVEASVHELAQYMYDFTTLSHRQRVIQRNRTERLSDLFDWSNLSVYYRVARQLALHRLHPDIYTEEEQAVDIKYPRPISEPPTPAHSIAGDDFEYEDKDIRSYSKTRCDNNETDKE